MSGQRRLENVGILIALLCIGLAVAVCVLTFHAEHRPAEPAGRAVVVQLGDGTSIRCVDFGEWGQCEELAWAATPGVGR